MSQAGPLWGFKSTGEVGIFDATYEDIHEVAGVFVRLILEVLADDDTSLDSPEHVLALCQTDMGRDNK